MSGGPPDLLAWEFTAAGEYLKERGLAYVVRETKAPRAKDSDGNVEKRYVIKVTSGENGVWELLLCGKPGKEV